MHTAQHLVARCLSGTLAHGRTIILVTHHFDLCMPIASYILELSHGEVLRQGFTRDFEDLGQLKETAAVEDDVPDDPHPISGPGNEADAVQNGQQPTSKSLGKLIDIEARAEGRVSWLTYMTYIRAAGILSWILTVVLMLLIRAINISNQVTVVLSLI